MSQPTQEEIFKTVATRIVGAWYYFNRDGSFTFYTLPSIDQPSDVLVVKGDKNAVCRYQINVIDHQAVKLIIAGNFISVEAIIKVLTNDSLILQNAKDDIEILQRMTDMDFADRVINGL